MEQWIAWIKGDNFERYEIAFTKEDFMRIRRYWERRGMRVHELGGNVEYK